MIFHNANYASLEMQIASRLAVDTETQSPLPAWTKYKRIRFDMDGLVHRVTFVREFGVQVHDEVMIEVQPWTGCGISLRAVADEGKDDPERVGFAGEELPLTCMACASSRIIAGDVQRQVAKHLSFVHSYSLKHAYVPRQTGRKAYVQALKSYQALVRGYAAHDAASVLALGRRPRYSATFMQQLARAVLR